MCKRAFRVKTTCPGTWSVERQGRKAAIPRETQESRGSVVGFDVSALVSLMLKTVELGIASPPLPA